MISRIPRPTASGTLAATALFVALGGTGIALTTRSIPDAKGTFHGCVGPRQGGLRLVAKATDCKRNERAVAWQSGGLSSAYFAEDDVSNRYGRVSLSVHVPAGSYLVTGQCTATRTAANPAQSVTYGYGQVSINASGPPSSSIVNSFGNAASVPDRGGMFPGHFSPPIGPFGSTILIASGGLQLLKPGEITMTCMDSIQETTNEPGGYGPMSLIAIPVASLHVSS